MKPTKLFATLVLTMLTAMALQAQNHHNNTDHNGQGNNQSNYNNGDDNYYGHGNNQFNHQEHNYIPQLRTYKGFLVSINDNNYNSHSNWNDGGSYNNHSSHNQYAGWQNWDNEYGIVLKSHGNDPEMHRFDDRGNFMVREMLRNHRNFNRRAFIQVKGRMDRHGTIIVKSVRWIGKPVNDASYFSMNFGNDNDHPNWSFRLFVGLD